VKKIKGNVRPLSYACVLCETGELVDSGILCEKCRVMIDSKAEGALVVIKEEAL